MVLKVVMIGSGNWGTAVVRIVGNNVKKHNSEFDETVKIYVYEEMVDGKKLTEIINTEHENVKYLKGFKIPPNVVAVPDVIEAAKDADVLIFCLPHQFTKRTIAPLAGKIKPSAVGISLIKGVSDTEDGSMKLITEEIKDLLKIEVWALMGANLADEVAKENFCEATIGCSSPEQGAMLKKLFHNENFHINVVPDVHTVELCGALKNVVGCAAGFSDGLKYGDNTKAAIIRIGLLEMQKFIDLFYPGSKLTTYFESCGVADLITTCYGGRNRRCSEAFVKGGKTIQELEKEMLGGQLLQGPQTATQVNKMLKKRGKENEFPLFTSVYKIFEGQMKPDEFADILRKSRM